MEMSNEHMAKKGKAEDRIWISSDSSTKLHYNDKLRQNRIRQIATK